MMYELGIVKEIIEEAGLSLSFAYEDLVIIENNTLIIQFDEEKTTHLKVHFNQDLEDKAKSKITNNLLGAALSRHFSLSFPGSYVLNQKDGIEELELKFIPA